MQNVEPDASGTGKRIAVAVARFNQPVTELLLAGALDALRGHGVAEGDIAVVHVPGAFELPLTCRWLVESGNYDGVVALGAVIRGETDHYDYVCEHSARGLLDATVATSIPIGYGVLTCHNTELALARAGGTKGNKGADVAIATLEMINLKTLLS